MAPRPSDPQRPWRVLVVGGTGHISGALVEALASAGHEVSVFNRGTQSRPLPDGVRLLRGDRRDRAAFERTMREEAFDAAFDLICFDAEDARSDLRAFAGVGHFFQTSTVCTLGGPLAELPADEQTELRPLSEYGRAKVAADDVFLEAHREHGFPVTILKPANIWGAGMPLIRQLGFDPHWTERLRAERPLLIAGDGRQRWSLCHVQDAVTAYLGLLGQQRALGETYLLSSPDHLDWIEYHEQIAAVLGVSLRLIAAPAEDLLREWPEVTELLAEQSRFDQCFDVSKLQAALPAFEPRLTLRARALENIEWMDECARRAPAGDSLPDREDEVIRRLGLG
ncbi:MAG TPA: NAD-dependent epimerase/dehydratase family protein [Solirubrobacterales bacterium]|nr:NAD-dependent epimerase/dehydratase family protein [Solirubrobacterales bacterium]